MTAIDQLLTLMVQSQASDLHLSEGKPAYLRVQGSLKLVDGIFTSSAELNLWLDQMLSEKSKAAFTTTGDADFSFNYHDRRLRGSVYRENGAVACALRLLSDQIPTFDQIGLPQVARPWSRRDTGLIIITGPTGSGKSTTVASMVNAANIERDAHILTIEDPVEYTFPDARSVVRQREIGRDAADFPRAVRAALREDIDVLVIGEMRDLETMDAALTVAETGHLVFATLHTHGAAAAIDRIVNAFDAAEQQLIRARLAASLVGVMYQRLLPTTTGRVAAYEVLVANNAVRNLLREGKTFHIPNVISTSRAEGMQTMDRAIDDLIERGAISTDEGNRFKEGNL